MAPLSDLLTDPESAPRPALDGVWAVVVHHRSLATLPATVESLTTSGLPPSRLVCVDNSGDAIDERSLLAVLPVGARLLRVSNDGYGAAANRGLRAVEESPEASEAVLVCTHETVLAPGALGELASALRADPSLAAVGPVLRLRRTGGVWSTGGTLTRWLRHPRHRTGPVEGSVQDADWLDGACVLYRSATLAGRGFDPHYFLYLEETDLHQVLRSTGSRVGVVAAAVAEQDTGGMPDYWAARNMVMFQRRWGRPGLRWLSALGFVARRALGALRRGRLPSRQLFTGLRDGVRGSG